MILPLITHLWFSKVLVPKPDFHGSDCLCLTQFPENQVSRTDSFTLNVNRLPGISTLSYYPSEARKGSCFRFGHQPNTNVEVSQDAEFGAKL